MRVVVALGGNALQKRGEPMTVENQRANVRLACQALTPVAVEHELVISHGNGPQVGLLSLQASAYDEESTYPFDVLGAQTEGMIGYLIEQELGNMVPFEKPIATILTMTEVDADDPAMKDPSKFVGPVYTEDDAQRLAAEKGWTVKQRRRALAPRRALAAAQAHLRDPADQAAARGRHDRDLHRWRRHPDDVPARGEARLRRRPQHPHARRGRGRHRQGPLARRCSRKDLDADLLVIATDTDAVYLDWGTPQQRGIAEASPDAIEAYPFPAGSMGPKVEAAADFARSRPGKVAVIGALADITAILAGTKGTRITTDAHPEVRSAERLCRRELAGTLGRGLAGTGSAGCCSSRRTTGSALPSATRSAAAWASSCGPTTSVPRTPACWPPASA